MNYLTNFPFSKDTKESIKTQVTLVILGDLIKQVVAEDFPELSSRLPVIAGGAIRDLVFGKPPKDYDIFIPTALWPESEREDNVLVFGQLLLEKLSKVPGFSTTISNRLAKVGDENASYFGEDNQWAKNFFVYESVTFIADAEGGFVDVMEAIPEEAPDEDDWDFNPPQLRIQFIGRDDASLTKTDLTEFVGTFDYGLVQAWFDPTDQSYHFSPNFDKEFESKTIEVNNSHTRIRVWSFLDFFGYKDEDRPFKVIENGLEPKSSMTLGNGSWGIDSPIAKTVADRFVVVPNLVAPLLVFNEDREIIVQPI